MIAAARVDLIFSNKTEQFELYITDIYESEHEIEVYSEFLHPTLKRGWTGNLSYHTVKAYDIPSGDQINDDVYLVTVKDVLLRSVQCYNMSDDSPVEWKYTFLKD